MWVINNSGRPSVKIGEITTDRCRLEIQRQIWQCRESAAADELFAQEEEEALALGAVLAVEWPERLSQLPQGAWLLRLELVDAADPEAGRLAWLTPPGPAPAGPQ